MYTNTHGDMVVLAKGEKLMESLEQHANTQHYPSAFLSGLGAAAWATIGIYDPGLKDYSWKTYKEPLEILSLQGNLAWVNEKPFWHLHGSFSNKAFQTFGGHIKDLEISATGELLIIPLNTPLTRNFDDETGIKLLSDH